MTERYSEFPNFDKEAFSQALGTETRSLRDVAHGEGEAVTVGGGKAELEVYPSAGVARVTTENARVELFRVPGMTTDDEAGRVLFQHGEDDNRRRLLVRADGNVSFYPVVRATGSAPAAETAPSGPVDRQRTWGLPSNPEDLVSDTSKAQLESDLHKLRRARQTPADDTSPESAEQPAITLTGRLGRDPWFSRDEEVLIAGFPLAVNHEQGATIWHTVKARGEAADQVQTGKEAGYIRKGRQVSVTGSFDDQAGKGKATFEATAVTRVKSDPNGSNRRRS